MHGTKVSHWLHGMVISASCVLVMHKHLIIARCHSGAFDNILFGFSLFQIYSSCLVTFYMAGND